jgi:hypothetical protein
MTIVFGERQDGGRSDFNVNDLPDGQETGPLTRRRP